MLCVKTLLCVLVLESIDAHEVLARQLLHQSGQLQLEQNAEYLGRPQVHPLGQLIDVVRIAIELLQGRVRWRAESSGTGGVRAACTTWLRGNKCCNSSQHVLHLLHQHGTIADQAVAPDAFEGADIARPGKNLAVLLLGVAGGDQGAAARGGFDQDGPLR